MNPYHDFHNNSFYNTAGCERCEISGCERCEISGCERIEISGCERIEIEGPRKHSALAPLPTPKHEWYESLICITIRFTIPEKETEIKNSRLLQDAKESKLKFPKNAVH